MNYQIIGHLKKKVNWKKRVITTILGEKTQMEESLFELNNIRPNFHSDVELRVFVKEENRYIWKKNPNLQISNAEVFKIPVVRANLIPDKNGTIQGIRGIDWVNFVIKGTDWNIKFRPKEIIDILNDLVTDHRMYLRGDGTLKLTFTFDAHGARLLKEKDEIIKLDENP